MAQPAPPACPGRAGGSCTAGWGPRRRRWVGWLAGWLGGWVGGRVANLLGHVWCGMWLLWSLGGLLWSESGTTWRACLPQFPAHCTIAAHHSIPPLPQVAKTRVRVAEMKAGLAMMQAMHRGGWVGGWVGGGGPVP
jgi:hypothetical protein